MIYFIQQGDDGPIKIGYVRDGANAKRRVSTLQIGSPVELHLLQTIDGERAAERKLHDIFADSHIRGEWFNPSPELCSCIENGFDFTELPVSRNEWFSFKLTNDDKDNFATIAKAMSMNVTEWGKMAEVLRFALRLVALGFVTIPEVESE